MMWAWQKGSPVVARDITAADADADGLQTPLSPRIAALPKSATKKPQLWEGSYQGKGENDGSGDTEDHIPKFHQEERDDYEQTKQKFLSLNEHQRRPPPAATIPVSKKESEHQLLAIMTTPPPQCCRGKTQAQTFLLVRRVCPLARVFIPSAMDAAVYELMYTPLKIPPSHKPVACVI
ncbi:hypothetical protein AJ78_07802 [Emergomyces pasteurianus Ep9510]|uniref:Uncharacterized protein n=1 Tax=Emergomyces pasteurianus Ep9510 TaxID=1447872 RepID=A0A1J9Q8C7_9EURO|nr:hypothetical protein AJ78_07802 [Emergomyces pasteurianus Ep9510]